MRVDFDSTPFFHRSTHEPFNTKPVCVYIYLYTRVTYSSRGIFSYKCPLVKLTVRLGERERQTLSHHFKPARGSDVGQFFQPRPCSLREREAQRELQRAASDDTRHQRYTVIVFNHWQVEEIRQFAAHTDQRGLYSRFGVLACMVYQ